MGPLLELSSRGGIVAQGEGSISLGANCLAVAFLRHYSPIEAHLAALDVIVATGLSLTEISHPGLLSRSDAPRLRRHAEANGLRFSAVHAPMMRHDPTLGRQKEAA